MKEASIADQLQDPGYRWNSTARIRDVESDVCGVNPERGEQRFDDGSKPFPSVCPRAVQTTKTHRNESDFPSLPVEINQRNFNSQEPLTPATGPGISR